MADRNLTSAIFELKDRNRSRNLSASPKPNLRKTNRQNVRRRSFDTFYFFAVMLLAMATIAQFGAIIAYR